MTESFKFTPEEEKKIEKKILKDMEAAGVFDGVTTEKETMKRIYEYTIQRLEDWK